YVGTQTTREYRAIITNTTDCRYDTTNASSTTINPVVLGNSTRVPTASQGASICVGANFNVQVNNPSLGADTTVKGWLTNANGGAWNITSTATQLNVTGNYYSSTTTL